MVRSGHVALRFGMALAFSPMLAGCLSVASAPEPSMETTNVAVGAGADVPGGGSEDFIVNVGRRTYFREGSAELDATARTTLDAQATWLKAYPRWTAKIQGFADDPGAKDANVALSAKRAAAVRSYLVSQGVAEKRLTMKGYGRDRLVRDCPDISCTSQNRRVVTNLEGDRDL